MVPQQRSVLGDTEQRDHVEAHGDVRQTGLLQVRRGQSRVAALLRRGDGVLGRPLAGRAARLDLAQHERLALERHDVDLAGRAAPVALDDVMPASLQIRRRGVLAALSQASFGRLP